MFYDELQLISGNDLPFPQAGLTIHQPTMKEIGLLSESDFRIGMKMLTLDKESYFSEQDKNNLKVFSDFDILMSTLNDVKSQEAGKLQLIIKMVLALIFPYYTITCQENCITFTAEDNTIATINSINFDDFKTALNEIFCLKAEGSGDCVQEYNPKGEMAKRIRDKLLAGRRKVAELKSSATENPNKIAIYSRYISILAVGERKDMNSLLNLTVYQLYDEYKRYVLKLAYDSQRQVALAGGSISKEIEDWTKDIH